MGGTARAHAAGVEGRLLAGAAGSEPGDRRPRPVGLPAAVASAACRTAGTPWPARRAPCRRSAAPTSTRSGPARSSPCRAPRSAVTRRSPRPPRWRAARSSSCTSRAPTRCGTGSNVHHVRQRLGVELARESGVDADVVIPVPDSSIPAAIGYSGVSGIPLQRRTDQEPLHRTHVHRAHPGHARARRGPEVQRPRREPGRQAGDHDRRLAGARHHGRAARQARSRRRRHRGPPPDHVPADHARLPLRRRHGSRRRPDGGAADGRGDAPADRRRQPRLPLARGHDARRRRRPRATATPASPVSYPIAVHDAQAKLSFEGALA